MKIEEVITILFGMVLGILVAVTIISNRWEHHNNIIKQGCGQYDSQTGKFKWKS